MADSSDVCTSGGILCEPEGVYADQFNDTVELDILLTESQMDALLQDTEVLPETEALDDQAVCDLETKMLDGCDTEVVPDSDDEGTDVADGKGFICRRGNSVERDFGDHSLVKSPYSARFNQDAHPNANTDACADKGLVSGQPADAKAIVCVGCDINHLSAGTKIPAIELREGDISEERDADLINQITCDAKCTDGHKQLNEEVLADQSGKPSPKPGNLNTRKIVFVYTRKRKRGCSSFLDNVVDRETSSPWTSHDYAGLSYVDSQEPVDMSKALLFVDQFVSVNAVHSSPKACASIKDKSPPSLIARAAQNLVRRAEIRDRAGETEVFEWDPRVDGIQSDSSRKRGQHTVSRKKYDKKYVRKSPCVKSSTWEEQVPHSDDTANAGEEKEVDENRTTEDCNAELGADSTIKELDQPVNEESELMQPGAGTIYEELEHPFDVGIDTQIAAEAIQELSLAAAADCNDVRSHKVLNTSLKVRKIDHTAACSYPKRARSASASAVRQQCSSRELPSIDKHKDVVQASEVAARNRRKKLIGECSGKFMLTNATTVSKGDDKDSFKENFNSLDFADDMPLCKVMRSRNSRKNFDSSILFNVKEGPLKVGPHERKTESGSIAKTSGVSDQTDYSAKHLPRKSTVTRNRKVRKGQKRNLMAIECLSEVSVNVESEQQEFGDYAKEGSGSTKMFEVANVTVKQANLLSKETVNSGSSKHIQEDPSYFLSPEKWYWRGYPRGKRACRSMVRSSDGSVVLEDSSGKLSRKEKSIQHPSNYQRYSDTLSNSLTCTSNVKRRLRSSVYISPCCSTSQMIGNRSLLYHSVSDGKQIRERKNSDNVIKSTITGKLDKGSNEEFDPSLDDTRKGADRKSEQGENLRLSSNVNLKSQDSEDITSRTSPLLTNIMKSPNVIDGFHEQLDKKKAMVSPLTRELVRLGYSDSPPDLTSKDSRRRKTMGSVRVLFSQNLDKRIQNQQKKILVRLGVPMASCPSEATHFIADKFARTRNMLEFIAQGKPVVTHLWLESCEQAGFYIDERNYILRDLKKEQELGFKLPISLNQARQHPLLKGYRVLITPGTQPGREILTSLVKATQGQVVDVISDRMDTLPDDVLILSCEEDRKFCAPFLRRGAAAYSPELLLNGVVIQALECDRHLLFRNNVRRR